MHMTQTALRNFSEVLSYNGLLPRLGSLPVIRARSGHVILGVSALSQGQSKVRSLPVLHERFICPWYFFHSRLA